MGNSASLEVTKGETSSVTRTVSIMQNKDISDGNENRRNNSYNKADGKVYKANDDHVHKDAIFTALREAMVKINKFPNLRDDGGKWRKDLRGGLTALSKQIDAIENLDHLAYGVIQSYMREASRLVLSSNTLHIVCSVVNVGWSIYYKEDGIHFDPDNFAVIKLALKIMVSFSDSSDEIKCDMAKDENFLKTLTKILKTCYNSDNRKLEQAVGAIWALAFDKENQRIMLEDKTMNIVNMLLDLTKCLDIVRKAAEGTLWTLRNQLKHMAEFKDLDLVRRVRDYNDQEQQNPRKSDARRKKGHVMISYNRNHREVVKWIRDELEANGYPVWMDIGNMGGSTSQTMAEAIESAHVFLFCCSQGYKNSNNCRQEADYASSLGERLHMIPLLMEEGYKADGWLGFYVGREYFYDFSGKYPREHKLQELLLKLNKCYQKVQQINTGKGNPISRAQPSVSELRKWTVNDIGSWIKKHNLPREQFENITGRDLSALITMRMEAPECFYRRIRKDFKIKSLSTTDLFVEALDDLATRFDN